MYSELSLPEWKWAHTLFPTFITKATHIYVEGVSEGEVWLTALDQCGVHTGQQSQNLSEHQKV